MLLLQGGIWDLIVLCVLWVGAAACQKKDVMPAFYLKSFFFLLWVPLLLWSDPRLHVWSPFWNLGASRGQWIPLGGLSGLASVWAPAHLSNLFLAANNSSSNLELQTVPIPKQRHALHLKYSNFFVPDSDSKQRTMFLARHRQPCVACSVFFPLLQNTWKAFHITVTPQNYVHMVGSLWERKTVGVRPFYVMKQVWLCILVVDR